MPTGKRDSYWNEPPKVRNMKGDVIWRCTACGTTLKENPHNPAMGFDDWTGVLICPDCKSSMKREDKNE